MRSDIKYKRGKLGCHPLFVDHLHRPFWFEYDILPFFCLALFMIIKDEKIHEDMASKYMGIGGYTSNGLFSID